MTLSSFADLVTGISYPLIAAAPVVSIVQTGMLRRSNESIVYQHIARLMIEIDQVFVERPELRPYFYDNRPLPGDGEAPHRQRGGDDARLPGRLLRAGARHRLLGRKGRVGRL